jgi:transcription-repair coupling factor (superfamily II helicase)
MANAKVNAKLTSSARTVSASNARITAIAKIPARESVVTANAKNAATVDVAQARLVKTTNALILLTARSQKIAAIAKNVTTANAKTYAMTMKSAKTVYASPQTPAQELIALTTQQGMAAPIALMAIASAMTPTPSSSTVNAIAITATSGTTPSKNALLMAAVAMGVTGVMGVTVETAQAEMISARASSAYRPRFVKTANASALMDKSRSMASA